MIGLWNAGQGALVVAALLPWKFIVPAILAVGWIAFGTLVAKIAIWRASNPGAEDIRGM
jgi:hypothetical protein